MDLDELFELLVARFWVEPPANLSSEEYEDWQKQKQVMIRLRCVFLFYFIRSGLSRYAIEY